MQRMQRLVGVFVIGAALLGAVLLGVAVVITGTSQVERPTSGFLFGIWKVVYAAEPPSLVAVLGAIGLALLLAATVAVLEERVATRSRRSLDAEQRPLAPRIVMAETRGVFAGPVTVTVLIPAHNEEDCIGATIASLKQQSRPPERIVVVADNCTDRTVQIAEDAAVTVFPTIGNTKKKAGGLNQALAAILPDLGDNDVVMVMDADTVLDQGFLEAAVQRMTDDRALMAVGGLFYGEQGHGLIGQFQRNEYARYAREIRRRRGKVYVLTGTASVFRPRALRTVADERGRTLPGVPGDVYDTIALTEDNELTLAIRSLGGLMVSPAACTVVTELMPTWKTLWNQRLRWQRGALENLGAYGFRPSVTRYWAQQMGIGYGAIALLAYFVLIIVQLLAAESWVWFPFWIVIGMIFMIERVVTAWGGGWRARVLGLLVFPELFYATFLNLVFLKGILDISLQRTAQWTHLTRETAQEGDRR
ncbi:glycosyltransferase family 2 protein [Microlunatus sp. Gsoil 973]|uniref:glycosyltransferase n=1 Tax=Microlunatus sp. Gsoil 973 TaxID=2672569 RepID=UPI0012B4A196|nr:glycosyltransferase family 2 protein [Microlunatus sp. Gsoil 973]QGN31577.1 glycosyltransferase [Microlunatus sp. Gsoil 973]